MNFYEPALLIVCSVSLVLNIFQLGIILRWIRISKFWKKRYDDAIAPVEPVPVHKPASDVIDPNYWEEEWD